MKQLNEELYEENEQLLATNDQLVEQNREHIKMEEKIREEMTEYMMKEFRRKELAVEARLQVRIDFLQKRYAEDVIFLWCRFNYCIG